jgi:MFS family permease
MANAGASEHPATDGPELGEKPAHAGIDTSGRLIKAGIGVFAFCAIGGMIPTAIYGLLFCRSIGCGLREYLPPLVPIALGLAAIWAGRGALRGTRSGLIGVALYGSAILACAILLILGFLYNAILYSHRLFPELLISAAVVGGLGLTLLAGVRGRVEERRRMAPSQQ